MNNRTYPRVALAAATLSLLLAPQASVAQPAPQASQRAQAVVDHWTPARRDAATPRDLVIDGSGQGYLRRADGTLERYGRSRGARLQASPISPNKKPPDAGGGGGGGKGGGGGGGGDGDDGGGSAGTAPDISALSPNGETIGASHTFSAVVTDADGVKSVTFVINYPDGSTTQSLSASNAGGDTWALQISGFSNGDWSWHVEAKDRAKRGGNTAISSDVPFTVATGGSGGTGGGGVTNSQWTGGGVVQQAAGRIYFEMPDNQSRTAWSGYVCSGTAIHDGNDADNADGSDDRSVILTAAHCVYDDANKAFARNVLFIPDQASGGFSTDTNCSNDPIGCWTPNFGVIDDDWAARTFPQNIEWDYAFYVVDNRGQHVSGQNAAVESLEEATGTTLVIDFNTPEFDNSGDQLDVTHALGYSYADDPNFMYCAEDMTTEGTVNWWLPNCELSGGSSGGPWVQPMDEGSGSGPVISVNSWGYTTSSGMAGPEMDTLAAICLHNMAQSTGVWVGATAEGDAGTVFECSSTP